MLHLFVFLYIIHVDCGIVLMSNCFSLELSINMQDCLLNSRKNVCFKRESEIKPTWNYLENDDRCKSSRSVSHNRKIYLALFKLSPLRQSWKKSCESLLLYEKATQIVNFNYKTLKIFYLVHTKLGESEVISHLLGFTLIFLDAIFWYVFYFSLLNSHRLRSRV